MVLNYFSVHLVSNMGSHNTQHALIVLHVSECWLEDVIIRLKHFATIKY